jgi:hypothetical protein
MRSSIQANQPASHLVASHSGSQPLSHKQPSQATKFAKLDICSQETYVEAEEIFIMKNL